MPDPGPRTARGERTRERLLRATTAVVARVGYAHATTRAIAEEAGVAEGTIYRHFPDKTALFFAAVMDRNAHVLEEMARLPDNAGSGTVAGNLTHAITVLAGMRHEIVPLEMALMHDPAAMERRARVLSGAEQPPHPPAIADYLRAEQALGRVRHDVDCARVELVLLAAVFGIATLAPRDAEPDPALIDTAVRCFVEGIAPA